MILVSLLDALSRMSNVHIAKEAILLAWGSSTILNIPHAICEHCGKTILDHNWLDFDDNDTIVRCSFKEQEIVQG